MSRNAPKVTEYENKALIIGGIAQHELKRCSASVYITHKNMYVAILSSIYAYKYVYT